MKNLKWIKPLLIVTAVAAVLVLGGKYLNLQQKIADVLAWIEGLGPAGMGVYALLYIVACVFFIPGSLLTLGAGAIYGVVTGSILLGLLLGGLYIAYILIYGFLRPQDAPIDPDAPPLDAAAVVGIFRAIGVDSLLDSR